MNILGPLRLGLLAGLLLGAQAQAVRAAEVVAAQEYDKYIDKHKTIHPLDWSLFGEQINARDGGVSFKVVDGELEGAGPTLKIVRTFKLRETNRFVDTSGTEAIGWNFEVPRMKTVVNATAGTIDSPYGWQVPGADKNARCSHFAAPGLIRFADIARLWDDHEWWSGYQIVDDTGNEQEVLRATSPETQAAGFVAVTSGNWRLSCLASTSNGQPGEAFLAIAPDGTRYWFDYLVYTNADSMSKTYEQTPSYKQGTDGNGKPNDGARIAKDYLLRKHANLLLSRMQDRFGNELAYHYSNGALVDVTASDGRVMKFVRTASGLTVSLGSATGSRSWTYATVSNAGVVTLPDQSAWVYNFATLAAMPQVARKDHGDGSCESPNTFTANTVQASATSPSGVTGTFTFSLRRFGRSYVVRDCFDAGGGNPHAMMPKTWMAFALSQRSFSGPGIPTHTWNYSYSPPNASWYQDCAAGCISEVWNDVVGPDGVRERTVFSNRYDQTENLLLRQETYGSGNQLIRVIRHGYASAPSNAWPYPWPRIIGDDLQLRTNKAKSERWSPATWRQTEQQGRRFTWEVASQCGSDLATPCFDALARPTLVVKSTAPAP